MGECRGGVQGELKLKAKHIQRLERERERDEKEEGKWRLGIKWRGRDSEVERGDRGGVGGA